MSDTCKIITISNLYFKGYFPQLEKYNKEKIAVDFWACGGNRKFDFHYFTDREVLKLIIQGMSNEEIIEKISDDHYYSLSVLQAGIEAELEEFKRVEESIEIKISDFMR